MKNKRSSWVVKEMDPSENPLYTLLNE